ncbi:hypothetical protein, partial [Mesorhizobium sp.]|uniref:hypothetical protein n=1 Tax=Mesorhizobium sp. TaxID=1871066 RepID=UPI00345D9229
MTAPRTSAVRPPSTTHSASTRWRHRPRTTTRQLAGPIRSASATCPRAAIRRSRRRNRPASTTSASAQPRRLPPPTARIRPV